METEGKWAILDRVLAPSDISRTVKAPVDTPLGIARELYHRACARLRKEVSPTSDYMWAKARKRLLQAADESKPRYTATENVLLHIIEDIDDVRFILSANKNSYLSRAYRAFFREDRYVDSHPTSTGAMVKKAYAAKYLRELLEEEKQKIYKAAQRRVAKEGEK